MCKNCTCVRGDFETWWAKQSFILESVRDIAKRAWDASRLPPPIVVT
jgi:hypothetical protein